jgi:hypothetical protein
MKRPTPERPLFQAPGQVVPAQTLVAGRDGALNGRNQNPGHNAAFLDATTLSRILRETRKLSDTAVRNIGEKLAPSAVTPDTAMSNDSRGIRRSG